MCDTWGRQNPARHRPQRESLLDLFHARACGTVKRAAAVVRAMMLEAKVAPSAVTAA